MAWNTRIRRLWSRHSLLGVGALVISLFGRLGDLSTGLGLPNVVSEVWNFFESELGYWSMLLVGLLWLGWLVVRPTEPQVKPTLEGVSKRLGEINQTLTDLVQKVEYIEQVMISPSPYVSLSLLSLKNTDDILEAHIQFDSNIHETIVAVHMEISGEVLDAEGFDPLDLDENPTNPTRVVRFRRPSWWVAGNYEAHIYGDGNSMKGWSKRKLHSLTVTNTPADD